MPIILEWDNPEMTIFRIEVRGQWTWEEFDTAIDEGYRVIAAQSPKKIDLIMCVNTELPAGNAMPHMRRAGGTQPPNANRSVIVNESGMFLELVVQTVVKSKRWDGPAMVKTLDEARELLAP